MRKKPREQDRSSKKEKRGVEGRGRPDSCSHRETLWSLFTHTGEKREVGERVVSTKEGESYRAQEIRSKV